MLICYLLKIFGDVFYNRKHDEDRGTFEMLVKRCKKFDTYLRISL